MSGTNERPPEGWDAQAGPPSATQIADEILAGHLGRRAARPAPRALAASIMARVHETAPERRWRLAVAAWRPRMARAAGGLAFVLVACLLVINAMPAPVGTDRGTPAPPASTPVPAPSNLYWDPTQRALTPPELLQILKTDPAVGTTLIVDDQIAPTNVSCGTAVHCPAGQLVNAGGTFVESPTGGELPFTTESGSQSITGPVALAVGSSPNLVYLGSVVSNGLRLGFTVSDLQARSASGSLFVIPGWLSPAPARSCPSAPDGCVHADWLTEAASAEPDRAEVRFAVQPGAFLAFAAAASAGVPSEGTYLVRDGDGHGEIVARLLLVPIPSPDMSPPPIGTFWNATQRPLAPAELVRIMEQHPPVGTVLIVDDEIEPGVFDCATPGACPDGTLVDARTLVWAPVGGHLPVSASGKILAPVALQVAEATHLVFLGTVARNGRQMDFTANDLIVGGARDKLYVARGWLWKAEPMPCPTGRTTPPPSPTSELGLPAPEHDICAGANYLTDDAPTLPPTVAPSDRFLVQNSAYRMFAPFPDGSARLAVFLVRDWGSFGEIVARLDPLHIPAGADRPTSPTSGPTSGSNNVMAADEFVGRVLDGSLPAGAIVVADIPASAVTVLSPTGAGAPEDASQSRWVIVAGAGSIHVDGIAQDGIAGSQAFLVEPSRAVLTLGAVTTDDVGPAGLFVIHGWLRNGPPLPCPAPQGPIATGVRGEPLAWSQCPGTWILPTVDDPWAGPPNNVQATDGSGTTRIGDPSVPAGTLHVQDNAAGAYVEAVEGVWLVRKVVSNPCPPGDRCPFVPANRPLPGVSWYELVGPIVAPYPDAVEPRPSPTPAP